MLPNPQMPVSLCMIVKDEEANLPHCLASVADLMSELVLVDTGSTDRTRDIARQFGARVFDFPWVDDYSAARNESLRHATGKWVFWLDADEFLDADNRQKLAALFARLTDENVAYLMKQYSPFLAGTMKTVVFNQARLFPNHPDIRWQYRVHEQVLPSIERAGGKVSATDIVIQHSGFQNADKYQTKNEYYLLLLEREVTDRPDDPFTLFNLGWAYHDRDRHVEALTMFQKSMQLAPPGSSMVRKLYAMLARCHRGLGQLQAGLTCCQEGRQHYPEDTELLFMEGLLRCESGDMAGGEACWRYLLQSTPVEYTAIGVDPGLRGHITHTNLALLYESQGRIAEAEQQWRAVLAERPDHNEAWAALARLWRTQGRWHDLWETARQLDAFPDMHLPAVMFRASTHLARRELADARQVLEEALLTLSHSLSIPTRELLWPKLLLCEVLLQEGGDLKRIEQALREVLTLEPNHSWARKKLTALLSS